VRVKALRVQAEQIWDRLEQGSLCVTESEMEKDTVEEVLDSRRRGRGMQYLLKWRNREPSWEASRTVNHCHGAIKEFHKANPKKAGPLPRIRCRKVHSFR